MSDLAPLFFAALLLVTVITITYRRWVVRLWGDLDTQQRGALALILLTLAGGFVGACAWWFDDVRSFSWDLPPLASRMLAAAGWSFTLLGALVLQRPTTRRIRLAMLLLFVYLVPLAAVILAFHLDRFNFAQPIAYSFFLIVGVMTTAATWYLARPPRPIIPSDARADAESPGSTVNAWLLAVALVAGAWGLALFATDAGPSDLDLGMARRPAHQPPHRRHAAHHRRRHHLRACQRRYGASRPGDDHALRDRTLGRQPVERARRQAGQAGLCRGFRGDRIGVGPHVAVDRSAWIGYVGLA